MGMDYYFYKSVNEDGRGKEYVDSSRWCGVPDSDVIEKFGAQRITPNCAGCQYEEDNKAEDHPPIICYECWDSHVTYLITRKQATEIQKIMECNETLFTDMMDEAEQDYIYLRYDY